jgi:3'(2'), 5'-bisphosphate nucleotidase
MLEHIDLEKIKQIAIDAGNAIMKIYTQDFTVNYKEDNSPLTQADILSNEIICSSLIDLYPNIPILSEENKEVPYETRREWSYYWCIDPIDGTKEFIKKNGEFTVNIALVHKNTPVLGVVYAPALDELYSAKKGSGAFKNGQKLPFRINENPTDSLRIVASKSHLSEETQTFIDDLSIQTTHIEQVSKGSSLKLVMVAEGEADIYPRLAPTMEWDTAAADAIVRESGKRTYQYNTPSNTPLLYNKKELLNPWFIVK